MHNRLSCGLHIFALLCCFITICCNFAVIFGTPWWKVKASERDYGLLRNCKKSPVDGTVTCEYRDDVFNFDYLTVQNEVQIDIIFILVLISTGMVILGMLTCLLMFSCRREKKTWYLGCISTGIILFVGALSAFGAVIYGQCFGNKLSGFKIGWCAILAWLSASSLLFASIFDFLLLCVPPKGQDGGVVKIRSTSNYPIFMNSGSLTNSGLSYRNSGYDY